MPFGSLLKEYIKKQNLTIYQLAKETGIDRSFLQGVLNGKRKLPKKRFSDIVNTNYFTANQIHELCSEYFLERFGENKIRRFEYLENGITGKIKEELNNKYETELKEIKDDTVFYYGKKDVLAVVYTLLNETAVNSFASNFSFSITEINRIVFNACKEKRIKEFIHYVTPRYDSSIHNLEIIFNSLYYAETGYNTHINNQFNASYLFPYFILTDKYLLMFDETAENAVLFNANLIEPYLKIKSTEIKNSCKKIVHITENAFEFMTVLDTLTAKTSAHQVIGYDNQVCPTFITPEIIQAIATPAVKNIPVITQQLISHYDIITGNQEEHKAINALIVTYTAIADFVKNGYLGGFPRSLANPVPLKMRPQILKAMTDKNNIENLIITNPNMLGSDYDLSFQLNDNSLFICCGGGSGLPDDYNGKITLYTDNDTIVNDFRDYIEYLSLSEKTYTNDVSTKIINSFIDQLEAE